MLSSIAMRHVAHSIAFSLAGVRQHTKRAFGALMLGALLMLPLAAQAAGKVVISQVYGGGGNSGATYKNDFIELFNSGDAPVNLNGWSVQYASATGATWATTSLTNVNLAAGQYYLVQESAGTGGTTNLPTPDATGTLALSGTAGKVALVNATTALSGACPTSGAIVDFIGFSGTASCSEPIASFAAANNAPAPSNTTADIRAAAGCTDSDNNASDFTAGAPNPRNTSATLNPCSGGGSTPPSGVGSANPSSVLAGATTLLTVAVTQGSNPASPIQSVTADLSAIGGSATQILYDDGSNGDALAGDGTYSFSAAVGGATGSGSKSLPVTIVDTVPRTGTTTIALTITSPPLTIMQIQGHGAASAYALQTVTTNGNVVTAVGPKGFFIQDPAGDGDVSTSDAIYVYMGAAPPADVVVGALVSVTGQVQEFNGSTEIAASPSVSVTGTGTVPAAIEINPSTDPTTGICTGGNSTINPPVDGYQAANFACLDGMLVKMTDGIVTGATMGTGADGVHAGSPSGFYATPSSLPRPFREVGAQYPGLSISGKTIPVFDGDPEIVEIYYPGLGFNSAGFVYNAGQHFGLTGIIQGYQGSYEIYPTSLTTIGTAPTYPIPVADSVPGTLTIGTQNMLHFFNSTYDGGNDTSQYTDTCGGVGNTTGSGGTGASDTCPTQAEYQTRLKKMSLQIRTVLKAPVVQAVQEVENYSVLTDLANQIHADDSTITYVPYTIAGNDPGGINLGVLVRSDVTVNSVTQLYKGTLTSACSSGTSCLLNDRPPMLLDAVYNGYHFRVLLIYDRSLINLGVNDYVGQKRTAQAVQVASIVQALQTTGATLAGAGDAQQSADGAVTAGTFDLTGDATAPLTVLGDFNAYEFTDGYVDVTGMIMGTAIETQNQYWDTSGTYVPPSPVLFDTGTAAVAADHYSYNFDGYAQEIDHILLSERGEQDFIAVSNAHGNSDVSEAGPDVLDATTARRTSDHDGQVVTLGYVVTPSASAHGTISASTVQTVSKNATPSFTLTPDLGYTASVGGTCGGSLSGTTFTTAAVTANCTVIVNFTASPGYVSLVPSRVLDTRSIGTTSDGQFAGLGAVSAGQELDLTVLGRGGVPASGVTAVVLNVTATNPTAAGYVTVWPSGSARPRTSNLNILPGETIANLVIVQVGSGGQVALLNAIGSTDLIADVAGYFTTSSALTSVVPSRVLDTRTGATTSDGLFQGIGPVAAGTQLDLTVAGRGGLPASGAGAVIMNVTATNPTAPGYLTVWPTDSARPHTSNLNFVAGLTIPNLTVTQISNTGSVSLFNSAGTTDLIGDVVGWFPPVSELTTLNPARLLDTRNGLQTVDGQFAGGGPIAGGSRLDLTVAGRGNVPDSPGAVVLNVTVTNPTAVGYLTAWPSGSSRPVASNINFTPGQTIANLVIAKVGSNGQVALFNSAGSSDVVVDVVGWFPSAP